MLRFIKILIPILFLAGCGLKPSIEDPKLSDRVFSLEEFFDGETVAHGQFQDVLGNVSLRFLVNIKGSWDGSDLVLVEDFTYEDGYEEQRIWTLTKIGENGWAGSILNDGGLKFSRNLRGVLESYSIDSQIQYNKQD